MELLAPLGPVYQAGTLSGNPVATACGLATLREIAKPGFFDALAARTRGLVVGLLEAAQGAGVAMTADCEGGMFGFFFAAELPQNYGEVMATDKERFNRFFHAMLERGVYLAPALYEAGFVSAAHSARRHRRDGRGGVGEPARLAPARPPCTCTSSASAAPSWAASRRWRARPGTASPAATRTSIRR